MKRCQRSLTESIEVLLSLETRPGKTCKTRELPTFERERSIRLWDAYYMAAAEANVAALRHPELVRILDRVWAYSDFVAQHCIRHPDVMLNLQTSGDVFRAYAANEYRARLAVALSPVQNDQQLFSALRTLRGREMLRIAWRDLAGWAELSETLQELSELADACLVGALDILHAWHCAEFGTPIGSQSKCPQALTIICMGKLGASELNFSSDIDVMYAYPEEGETRGLRVTQSNEEFFNRLAGRLTQALAATTADGFVFRVDTRLRPFGDAGPLALSFDAMEEYYQLHGRDWERYALIKARVLDDVQGPKLLTALHPFIYRRYLDFSAFEALRTMKGMIAQEVERRGLENNVKLGVGGIREIEFIAQAFQLIRGGRQPSLRTTKLLTALEQIGISGYLPTDVIQQLRAAYLFLRRTENRLQAWADQQTHSLPAEDAGRRRLAWSMGFDETESFERALRKHQELVQGHFDLVFAAPQASMPHAENSVFVSAWQQANQVAQASEALRAGGFAAPSETAELLHQLRDSPTYRSLTPQGRERMDNLMPLLLTALKNRPIEVTQRLCRLIEAVARRTAYLALLVEYPMGLSQLIKLCSASPWIAKLLTAYPLLLDELLDSRTLYAPLLRGDLAQEIRQLLQTAGEGDLEQAMERLRQFKQSNVLRVAAADVAAAVPLMRVSDHLTDIAEVVLDKVLQLAWDYLCQRHGPPQCSVDGVSYQPGFAIIGYGKLGGIELGYGSDLDLVFLHDSQGEQQMTAGRKPIDNTVFFTRLGQRIIHLLNAHTPSGVLYEVDMRLRPSGASGLLVSNIESFEDYHINEAWAWEHQALVRARAVAGNSAVIECFNAIRHKALTQERDAQSLRREVNDMRLRMRAELASRQSGFFDLKHDQGGIVDIEFMVQYGVLLLAHNYPQLIRWSDTIRLLESLAETGFFSRGEAQFLADAFRSYRAKIHALTLQEQPHHVDETQFRDVRDKVLLSWHRIMDNPHD